ncbi:MAG: hypothetical protein HN341_01850 [Verrucomicrobia bacterium]|nr:hypothetical protein [Verrucomicrobiota bacterium]
MAQVERDSHDFPPLPGDVGQDASTGSEQADPPVRKVTLREEEAEALRPTVERAILLSGQQDRKVLGTALSSVVGTALRRSVTGVFRRRILALNRFLVHTFSVEGLRWRFESLRTGKPFQQVVQEHSLTCPVTQVFLIHRRTGLLISQVQQGSMESQDGDMVSSMLTAIQSFVHDSFRSTASGQLEVIRIGDVTVLLEQGPLAILAGIITQGFAPQNLRQTFRRASEQLHDDYHDALVTFKGDAGEFEDVEPILEACLKLRLVKGEEQISPLTGVILVAPLIMLLVWGFFEIRQSVQWRQYLAGLDAQPGIVVVETGRRGTYRYVRGLRDPLAVDPAGLLVDAGIVPGDVISDWDPYHALDSEMVLERARRLLAPPDSVTLELREGTLFVEGTAPCDWVDNLASRVSSLHGISRVRSDGVKQTGADQQLAWNQYLAKLGETPGILVLENGRWEDAFYIAGMRDPMAPDPVAMLSDVGLNPDTVRSKWEPYQALRPELVIARARRSLAPPASVTLTLKDDVLVAEGEAAHVWVSEAIRSARGIAGISRFDTGRLQDTDMIAYNGVAALLEEEVFYYLANRRDLWPGQENKFRAFIENVSRFSSISRRLGGGYRIEVRGHTRASDNEEADIAASLTIADRFYSRLRSQHLDMELLVKRGMGGNVADGAKRADVQRREAHVSFRVVPVD